MKRVLIIGATSAIAEAVAQRYAKKGEKLFLVGRNQQKLDTMVDDLKVRGAHLVDSSAVDLTDCGAHEAVIEEAKRALGEIDIVLIAHGTLGDQKQCELSYQDTLKEFQTNALSVISLLTLLANDMEQRRSGVLAVISSVAGDRGRQSNYIYGATKATVSVFLQGLRNRLSPSNVQVLTIKPGFVDTPMTADIPNKGALWATPGDIADGIIQSIDKKRNVVYLPWFWWGIMTIIKLVPEAIFKRLKL